MRRASWLLLALCLGLVAGCTPVYMAPAANAPLFGSGGELHGQFQYDAVSGLDLQAAFSPFKHVGIQAGMSFLPWNDEDAREAERYYGEKSGYREYTQYTTGEKRPAPAPARKGVLEKFGMGRYLGSGRKAKPIAARPARKPAAVRPAMSRAIAAKPAAAKPPANQPPASGE